MRTFEEEQHFRQWWLWLLIIFITALMWWSFIQQIWYSLCTSCYIKCNVHWSW